MLDQVNKSIIKEYVRQNRTAEALNFIRQTYKVTETDAQKLLDAIVDESKQSTSNETTITKRTSNNGCGGCLNVFFKIISVFVGLWSVMFLSAFVFAYYLIENEKGDLVQVEATVLGSERANRGREHLIVEYTWENINYLDTMDFAVESGKYEVGEEIEVLIHPDHPTPAVLEVELHQNFLQTFESASETKEFGDLEGLQWILDAYALVFLLPGLLFLLISIFLWWLGGRFVAKAKQ